MLFFNKNNKKRKFIIQQKGKTFDKPKFPLKIFNKVHKINRSYLPEQYIFEEKC